MPRTRKWMVVLLTGGLLLAASAIARELDGVRVPDRIVVQKRALLLNGMGTRKATVFHVKVYVAALYLEARSTDETRVLDAVQLKRLTLRFVRDVTKDQVTDAWKEGFEKNAPKDARALSARILKLCSWMNDFRAGDSLTFTAVPGEGVVVETSSAVKGTIAGDDFARALLSIWLGPNPPNASLKAGLLGRE